MKYSLLGLSCEKGEDVIGITFPTTAAEPAKRGILGKIAKIYDPLGLASAVTLNRKILYRDACDAKVPWDGALPKGLSSRWEKWERSLPKLVRVPEKHGKVPGTDRERNSQVRELEQS